MSHRYHKKFKISRENEESFLVPPHSQDSFFSEPEFFIDSKNLDKLSEEEQKSLDRFLKDLVPVFISFHMAIQRFDSSLETLQRRYGFTEEEAKMLMDTASMLSIEEIHENFRNGRSINLTMSFLPPPVAENSKNLNILEPEEEPVDE